MNAARRRKLTKGNKMKIKGIALFLFSLFLVCGNASFAGENGIVSANNNVVGLGSAPAMLNVKDIILQYVRTGDPDVAKLCGVSRKDVSEVIMKNLKEASVPITLVSDARPPLMGAARIDLIPEVVSLNTQGGDCTSWVSLIAQTQNTLTIPPIKIPRNVFVTYWRSGIIVMSSQSGHGEALVGAINRLAQLFVKQYKIDQPPDLLKAEEEAGTIKK